METEKCETCGKELPVDQMEHDIEGVPLCPACWDDLVSEEIWMLYRRQFRIEAPWEEAPVNNWTAR